MRGPGKYDDAATQARLATQAEAVLLVVVKDDEGSVSVQAADADVLASLPGMLRAVADSIEADLRGHQ